MKDFPKIVSELAPTQDMGPWLCEKSEACINDLIELLKLLKGNLPNKMPYGPEVGETLQEAVDSTISGILYDLTKIYSFSNGAEWKPADRDLVFNELDEGVEKLQKKYGLIDETKAEKEEKDYEDFVSQLTDLLKGTRSPNRTLINELFDKYSQLTRGKDLWNFLLRKIERELDRLNMGEIDWPQFVAMAKRTLASHDTPQGPE
jgi:hypothetical protein